MDMAQQYYIIFNLIMSIEIMITMPINYHLFLYLLYIKDYIHFSLFT